jgi:hypothetical protein
LNSLPPRWRKAVALFSIFALGIVVDRLSLVVSPWLSRKVNVVTIQGTKGKGCGGPAGYFYLRFGRPYGNDDGFYEVGCQEHFQPSDDVDLYCDCD